MQSEKPVATNNGSNIRTDKRLTNKTKSKENRFAMNNNTTNETKLQFNSAPSRANLLKQSRLSRLPQRKTSKLPESPFLETMAFVCDECSRPLHLYGENFIETYTGGKANILRCLCDLHADEMEVA